jgi:hypothetical protein
LALAAALARRIRPVSRRAVTVECWCLRAANCRSGWRLDREGAAWTGYLINGAERLKLDEVVVDKAHLEIKMPGYLNSLAADLKDRQLQGEVVLNKLGENKDQHMPFHAQMGLPYRFYAPADASQLPVPSVAGRWAVNFAEEGAKPEFAVGEFTQVKDVVSGTFLTDTGDHRFLAGQVHDGELYLSTFDGAHAFLYHAKSAQTAPSPAISGRAAATTRAGPRSATSTRRCRMPIRSPPCAAAARPSTSRSRTWAAIR